MKQELCGLFKHIMEKWAQDQTR